MPAPVISPVLMPPRRWHSMQPGGQQFSTQMRRDGGLLSVSKSGSGRRFLIMCRLLTSLKRSVGWFMLQSNTRL